MLNGLILNASIAVPEKYTGPAGKSAYDLAVEEGFQGTLDQWLESLHGRQGVDGANGEDGKTPVKGEDYWTAADKEEIVQSVLSALDDGDEVSY